MHASPTADATRSQYRSQLVERLVAPRRQVHLHAVDHRQEVFVGDVEAREPRRPGRGGWRTSDGRMAEAGTAASATPVASVGTPRRERFTPGVEGLRSKASALPRLIQADATAWHRRRSSARSSV